MKYKNIFSFKVSFLCLCLTLSLCLTSCASKGKEGYLIGVDPSWFPLNVYGKQPNVLAFTNELLKRIGEVEGVTLQRVNASWDNLLEGLDRGIYHAALSSMEPYIFNQSKYSFADNFLMTGPVLVVREDSTSSKLEKLHEKEIAIFSEPEELLLMQKYPDSIGRVYTQVTTAFVDIIVGSIDGALVPSIEASGYVSDLYSNKLKIVTKPFTDEGLKLITLKNKNPGVIKAFNNGLTHLKHSGEYEKLLRKWKIGYWALSR